MTSLESAFESALAGFRFDEAEALVAEVRGNGDEMRSRIARERKRAEDAAQRLYQEIVRLATIDDHGGVAKLLSDENAEALIGLLPPADVERAQIHIAMAKRWTAYRRRRNSERLVEAKAALDRFDLEMARGLVALLDEDFLDEEADHQRDRLLLDIEARKMELAPLREAQRQMSEDERRNRSWWRRRRGN